MQQAIADLLAPLVRDHLDERHEPYYFGCIAGACDVLEKLGHITEAEYALVVELTDTDPEGLLSILYNVESDIDFQETPHAG